MAISSFRRIETKYVIDEKQKEALLEVLNQYMSLDPFCFNQSTYKIQNIYYDTLSQDLISKSVRKPTFKQKLRARRYTGQKTCFLEIKKKVDGVVGKRRVELTLQELDDFIFHYIKPRKERYIDQIVVEEIAYLLSIYQVKPNVYISYERLGFFDKNDKEFRITFDNKLHAKQNNFNWNQDDYEISLLQDGLYIMEIKSVKNYPLWLVHELSKLKIYPKSFSKYGTQYMLQLKEKKEGMKI